MSGQLFVLCGLTDEYRQITNTFVEHCITGKDIIV